MLAFFGRMLPREQMDWPTTDSVSNLSSGTEHIFHDRINLCDEDDLKAACYQMNREIISCTQSIVAGWSEGEKLQTPDEAKGPRQNMDEPDAGRVPAQFLDDDDDNRVQLIGDMMSKRIQNAQSGSSSSNIQIAGELELALRSWAVYCVSSGISDSLVSSDPRVEGDLLIRDVARELELDDEGTYP